MQARTNELCSTSTTSQTKIRVSIYRNSIQKLGSSNEASYLLTIIDELAPGIVRAILKMTYSTWYPGSHHKPGNNL
jgi:hypothetical protein